MSARVAVGPESGPSDRIGAAIREAGAQLTDISRADALVWTAWADPNGLGSALADAPNVRWVQLTTAGVDAMRPVFDDRIWTSAKDCYSQPIAEYVLSAALAARHHLVEFARSHEWGAPRGNLLQGANVAILGGGGIAHALIDLLIPFHAHIEVVRRNPSPMTGVDLVRDPADVDLALAQADLVVLALALTPETRHIIGRDELAVMRDEAWIINVARGAHLVTDDLVDALRDRTIGGAVLDVTDPEPLPNDHPLWDLPNCLVTPHTACTPVIGEPLLMERIRENVRRWGNGHEMLGRVDTSAGY